MCLPVTPAHNQQHINNIADHRIDQPPLIFADGRRSLAIFTMAYTETLPQTNIISSGCPAASEVSRKASSTGRVHTKDTVNGDDIVNHNSTLSSIAVNPFCQLCALKIVDAA
ncbi:GH20076 [Drosophila grimshawi]|uniref:GH20076 n=1 Tax=Drosophila grimshawi TaxID=7222 RepID=B4JRH7_DROGR|nr:GH20076 [Drosophila grimshawi]